jgi:hypothetical protein
MRSFHLKTEAESSLRNAVCNVQKHGNCMDVPSSQTFCSVRPDTERACGVVSCDAFGLVLRTDRQTDRQHTDPAGDGVCDTQIRHSLWGGITVGSPGDRVRHLRSINGPGTAVHTELGQSPSRNPRFRPRLWHFHMALPPTETISLIKPRGGWACHHLALTECICVFRMVPVRYGLYLCVPYGSCEVRTVSVCSVWFL